jgi:hypothetical protein
MMLATISSWDLFSINKLEEGSDQFVNPNIGVRDVLRNTRYLPPLIKQIVDFLRAEFEELCCFIVPIINEDFRSIGLPCIISNHPLKPTHA